MRCSLLVLSLLAGLGLPGIVHAQAKTKLKNVVLLIADDLGLDLGCYGNTVIKTPNLDALAKKGVRFARAYATVASCSPSRACILSGLYTHQSGQYGLQHPPHSQECHPWVQGIANLLRAAGYYTGIVGKFHVGPASAYDFEVVATKVNARDPAAMTKQAHAFLGGRKKDQPFLLVCGYTDPHRAKKGFANEGFVNDPAEVKYDPAKVIVPYHLPDQPEVRAELAEYYQSVSRMDRGVGQLLEMLRSEGLLEDTLILFVSDNGIPFPGAKTTLYAAGVHLPLIVHAPGGPAGRANNALASFVDITPTILDWAGAKGPKYKLPGRSLLPILNDDNPKGWDAVYGSHQFHEITMYYPMRSITTRTHKLILNLDHAKEFPLPSDLWGSFTWQGIRQRKDNNMGQRTVAAFLKRPREELFDLTKDPNELKNVAGDPAYAQVLADLRARLRAWQQETNDPWTILYREEKASFNK